MLTPVFKRFGIVDIVDRANKVALIHTGTNLDLFYDALQLAEFFGPRVGWTIIVM